MSASDTKFINVFKKLDKAKNPTHATANKLIQQAFPNLEFISKEASIYIRYFVKWKINNMLEKNAETIFKLIDDVYPKFYKNITTLDNAFSVDVKTLVSKRFGRDSEIYKTAKEMVALPYDVKGELLKGAKDKVEAKNRDYDIVDADEIYDIIKDNIISTDMFRRAIALLLCSGSREMELFATSEYEPIDVPSGEKNWVSQSKISKKKGVDASIKKPILYLSAVEFVEELTNMRAALNERYKKTVVDGKLSSAISTAGNKIAHDIFKHRQGFTMHVCRKIYAHMSYDIYESKPTVHGNGTTLSFWIQSVLAHEGQNAVASYNHIKLKHKLNPVDVPAKTEELISKVDSLTERLETLDVNADEKPLPSVIVKNSKDQLRMKKTNTLYEKYVEEKGTAPNIRTMERIAKVQNPIIPRRIVRLYMKWKYEKE